MHKEAMKLVAEQLWLESFKTLAEDPLNKTLLEVERMAWKVYQNSRI